jgi:hypothetical protein
VEGLSIFKQVFLRALLRYGPLWNLRQLESLTRESIPCCSSGALPRMARGSSPWSTSCNQEQSACREASPEQGHNRRFWVKMTIRTSISSIRTTSSARFYPPDAVLLADRFLPRPHAVQLCPRRREKNKFIKKLIFFSCLCGCWSRPRGRGNNFFLIF